MDVLEFLQLVKGRLFDGLLGGSDDPYAAVRVPKHRNPSGRTSAVAVEEPSEPPITMAVAGQPDDDRRFADTSR